MWSWGGDWDAFVQKAVTLVWNFFVVSRRCCIDFSDALAVFGLRWAFDWLNSTCLGRDYSCLLQKTTHSLPWAISPIHAQPTCMYVEIHASHATHRYIQYSYSQGIPVQCATPLEFPPTHTHILGYTFWKRPDCPLSSLAAPGQLVASSSAIHSCKEER
jgi:hypothetical protein